MTELFDTEVYTAEDFVSAHKAKVRCLYCIWAVTAVFVLLNALTYVRFLHLPYGADRTGPLALHALYTFLYVAFLTVYGGIRYRRIAGYDKTLYFVRTATTEENEGVFLYFTDNDQMKDGVEYDGAVFLARNPFREENGERRLFIDRAKPRPAIREGDRVRFVTQGGLLVRYRVVGHVDIGDNEEGDKL